MRENEEKNERKGMSRRSVLKGALAMSALAAGGGIALNMAAPGSAEAMIKNLPKKWDETWDVVVVGSGFAGLAAAAEAAGGGAKVVVLEKMPIYGGNSIINGGLYASSDDKFQMRQKMNLGDDSPKLHAEDTLKGGDFYNIPELVKIMAENATDGLNWMMTEGGLTVRQTVLRTGGHSAYRTRTSGTGRTYTEALRKIAEKKGAKIILNNEISWIWRKTADPKSPILGLEVKRGKKVLNIKALKAVVIASGGFSKDEKMRMAHYPMLTPDFLSTNQPGATGEMIRYAQAIGADTLQLNFIQLYPYADPETGVLDPPGLYPFNGPGAGIVYVTKKGKRFISELERRDRVTMIQLNMGSAMKPTYSIFNEEMVPKLGGNMEEVADGLKKGRFTVADSVAELARKIGMPADALVETINNHNRYLAEGKDPEFNKPITKAMLPMLKGPYYAVAQWPAVHHCMGGLRINTSAQVVDIFGSVIPKLYAAGEVAGGVHGSNRLGSNAIADCVVFGRIAGTNAAKEKA